MIFARGTVQRVYKDTAGGVLAQALTGTWTQGSPVLIEAATDFSPDGGDGFFEDEAFSYAGIEINESDAPGAKDSLLGVLRSAPVAHAVGTFVQEGSTETVTKMVDILVDGELFTGIPVDPKVYTYLKLGTYADDEMPVVAVEFDEDGLARVTEAPSGVAPLVGSDTETLPGTGDGDGTVDPETGNPPPGQGWEDGLPPSDAPVLTAVGGVGAIFLRATSISNGSAVTYKFYGHTSSGFAEDDTKFIGSVRHAGIEGFLPTFTVKDFPTGHTLDGGANDPVKNGTTYYFTCVPYDGSGAGPTSNEVSATPVLIATVDINTGAVTEALLAANAVTETKIANDSVTSPKIVARTIQAGDIAVGTITASEIAASTITGDKIAANEITSSHIAANTIVAGDIAAGTITGTQIAATTITADKLSVSTLSAITANLGTITAGSISSISLSAVTISSSSLTSSSITSPSGSPRGAASTVSLDDGEVLFVVQDTPTPDTATIQASTSSTTGVASLYLTGTDVNVEATLKVDIGSASTRNHMELRTTGASPSAPGTGRCIIFYDGSAGTNGVLKARNPTSTQTLATF